MTYPDGSLVSPGQEFTKTWRIQNTGTCAWTTAFKVVFSYGEPMSGQTTALPGTVKVGDKVDEGDVAFDQ